MEDAAAKTKIFGKHDEATLKQIERCVAAGGERGVLCADGHKGYAQPIGGVVAYKDKISLSGVGFDIACGNLAIRTDVTLPQIQWAIPRIMDDVVRDISFGIGRKAKMRVDHEVFDDPAWNLQPMRGLKSLAAEQLGTVGGGNHYVDLFVDEEDRIWVGVHFGSRGLGYKTATYFLRAAGGKEGMDVPPTVVEDKSNLGTDYLKGMELAGRYAYAGREIVARHVARGILRANIVEEVHNHHNFAWREKHNGDEFWVVRKGATPAFPGQKSFVGGSMGDDAVIIEGIDSPISREALFSTVHGAGRIMSRTACQGTLRASWKQANPPRRACPSRRNDEVDGGSKYCLARRRRGRGAASLPAIKRRSRRACRHNSRVTHFAPARRGDGWSRNCRSI